MRSVKSKLFPYIHDTWVASNHWSLPSACNAPSALIPSAPWRRQPYEGEGVSLMRASPYERVSLRAPYEVFRHFLFSDKYYENWRIWKMLSTHVVVAKPCRHCKPSHCLWLQHLLFFFHIRCSQLWVVEIKWLIHVEVIIQYQLFKVDHFSNL